MSGACDICGRVGRIRKGWCDAHYFRWYRTGDPGSAEVTQRVRGGAECRIEGCTRRVSGMGYCSTHYARYRRHGDPLIVCVPTPRLSDDNPMWRGVDVGYGGMHQRIQRSLGSAREYRCVECGGAAAEWAYDHLDPSERTSPEGPYSTDLSHYRPMCHRCHRLMDENPVATGAAGRQS